MRTIIVLFVVVLAVGTAAPAQALPNYIDGKGVVYVANTAAGAPRVSRLDVATGPVWLTTLTGAPPDLTLSLTLDKRVVYVAGASVSIAPITGFLWALDAALGQVLWQTSMPGGGIYSSAAVEKGLVFVAGGAAAGPSRTTALDATSGQILNVVPAP